MSAPNIMASNTTQSLLNLLTDQQQKVDQLVELAQMQAALIADGCTDRLLDLLSKRQAIIDAFTVNQDKLGDYTRALDHHLSAACDADRNRIKSLINSIGERLSQVMQRDEKDQAMLRGSQNQVKAQMVEMSAVRQARGAYQPAMRETTRFADERG